MRLLRFLLLGIFVAFALFSSCSSDEDFPDANNIPVSRNYIMGGWGVLYNRVFWDLSPAGEALNASWNGKNKVMSYITEKSKGASLYFANDSMVFYVRKTAKDTVPFMRFSFYSLDQDTAGRVINFSNEYLMGFYAPKVFVEHTSNVYDDELTLFMNRAEVIEMLEHEEEVEPYIGMVKKYLEDGRVYLYIIRDSLDYYQVIDSCWHITH